MFHKCRVICRKRCPAGILFLASQGDKHTDILFIKENIIPINDHFIALLWQNTKEGYFSDPIHGGNKHAASWTMIGFPGARADYLDWVAQPGKVYPLGTVTIEGKA